MHMMIPLLVFFSVRKVKIKICVYGFFFLLDFFPQRISHFPARSEICKKYLLAGNMSRVVKLFPKNSTYFSGSSCRVNPS